MRFFLFLLLVGCSLKVAQIHLPPIDTKINSNITFEILNEEPKPWIVGEDLDHHTSITICCDVAKYIRARFLQRIQDKKGIKARMRIERFFIVIRDGKAYGLAKVQLRLEAPGKVAIKKIKVTPIYPLGFNVQRQVERMVRDMVEEIVNVMVREYEMFTL